MKELDNNRSTEKHIEITRWCFYYILFNLIIMSLMQLIWLKCDGKLQWRLQTNVNGEGNLAYVRSEMLLAEKAKLQVCFYFTLARWRPEKIEEKNTFGHFPLTDIVRRDGDHVRFLPFSPDRFSPFEILIWQKTRNTVYVSDNRFGHFVIRMSEIPY